MNAASTRWRSVSFAATQQTTAPADSRDSIDHCAVQRDNNERELRLQGQRGAMPRPTSGCAACRNPPAVTFLAQVSSSISASSAGPSSCKVRPQATGTQQQSTMCQHVSSLWHLRAHLTACFDSCRGHWPPGKVDGVGIRTSDSQHMQDCGGSPTRTLLQEAHKPHSPPPPPPCKPGGGRWAPSPRNQTNQTRKRCRRSAAAAPACPLFPWRLLSRACPLRSPAAQAPCCCLHRQRLQ